MNPKLRQSYGAVRILSCLLITLMFAVHVEATKCTSCSDETDKDIFPALGLSDAVHFWSQVFAVWQRGQVVLHDNYHLGIVYEVLALPGTVGEDYTSS